MEVSVVKVCTCGCGESFITTSKTKTTIDNKHRYRKVSNTLSGISYEQRFGKEKANALKQVRANGASVWMLGKKRTDVSIKQQQKTRKQTAIRLGYYHPEEVCLRIGQKNSIHMKKRWASMSPAGRSEIGIRLSKKQLHYWANLPTPAKNIRIRKMLSKVCQRPNKFETNALAYLNILYSDSFIYTGNGSLMINGRSADAFSKSDNTIALFHGAYWHLRRQGLEITEANKRSVEKVDSLPFTSAGYRVIFVWEDELNMLLNSVGNKG